MVDLAEKLRHENIKSNRFIAKACGIGALGLALSFSPLGKAESKPVTDARGGDKAKAINFAGSVGLLTAAAGAAGIFLETLNRGMKKNQNRQLLDQIKKQGGR